MNSGREREGRAGGRETSGNAHRTGPGSSSIVLEEHRWQLYAEMGLRAQENAGAG